MKVYRIIYIDHMEGTCLQWFRSKREATFYLPRLREIDDSATITSVTVPTDKQGLVCWLNIHLQRDNG